MSSPVQSKRASATEALISTGVGLLLSLSTQLLIFPLYGIEIKFHQNLQILAIFTFISIARQYVLRRVFNNITVKRMLRHDSNN
jgi:hypothetical protein